MKRDMQKVIIEAPRRRTTCSRCGVAGGATERNKRRESARLRDFGLSPRLKSKNLDYGEYNDRLNPLRRFLEKRLGQSWDDVWSEICSVNDRRSVTGYHLRLHVAQMVETEPLSVERFRSQQPTLGPRHLKFYVDPSSRTLACG
jgi:hypothetical protein